MKDDEKSKSELLNELASLRERMRGLEQFERAGDQAGQDRSQTLAGEGATVQGMSKVLDKVSDAFVSLDKNWHYVYVNEKAAQIFGRKREDLIGKHIWTELREVVAQPFRRAYEKAMAEQTFVELEEYFPSLDRWFENRIYPSEDGISVFFHDVTDRKRADEDLRRECDILSRIAETSPVGIVVVDRDGQVTFANPRAQNILGITKDEITQRMYNAPAWVITAVDGSPFPDEQLPFQRVRSTRTPVFNIQHAIQWPDGRRVILSINAAPIINNKNEFEGMLASMEDVTERKRKENQIVHLNRVYALLGQVNQAIVRCRSREELFDQICRVAIDPGMFSMAWIGILDDSSRSVRPVTWCGAGVDYLANLRVSVDDIPEGRGPTGTAVREGHYVFSNDIQNDPKMIVWRDRALEHGYRSSIALPIRLKGKVTGALNLYAGEPDFFDDQELKLLEEIADDVSFALENLDREIERKRLEDELRERESRLRFALEGTNDGLWDVQMGTGEVYLNPRGCEILGYGAEELSEVVKTWNQLVHPDDLPVTQEMLNAHLDGRAAIFEVEQRLRMKSGDWKWILARGKVVARDHDGNPARITGTHTDIGERKRAEEALRESEERFRNVFDEGGLGMAMANLTGGPFIRVNKAFCQMLGYSEEELGRLGHSDVTHPDHRAQDMEAVQRLREGQIQNHYTEKRYVKKNGDIVWAARTLTVVHKADGKPSYALAMISDITEREKAEAALRESEERLRLSTELANVAVWEFSFLTDTMSRSKNHDQLYGLDWQTKWEYQTFLNATHPDDRESSNEIIQTSAAIGGPDRYKFDFRVVYPDQSIHWLAVVGEVVERTKEGRAAVVRGCLLDITERKQAEKQLQASETKYRSFFENSMDAILLTAPDGTIHSANPAACKMFDRSEEEIKRIGRAGIVDMTDPHIALLLTDRTTKGSARGELTMWRRGETRFPAEVSSALFVDDEGNTRSSMIIRDITERKRAEAELQKRQEFIEAILEHAPIGFAVNTIHDGNTVYVGSKFEEIYGVDRGSLHSVDDYFEKVYIDPAYREEVRERVMSDIMSQDESRMRWENLHITTKDGNHKVITAVNIPLFEQNLMISTVQDFTERWMAQEAIRRSEEKFRSIYEQSPVGIELYNSEGLLLDVNPACLEIFGIRDVSAVKDFNLFEDPNLSRREKGDLRRGIAVKQEIPFDFEIVRKRNLYETSRSGVHYLDLLMTPVEEKEKKEGVAYIVHVRDITERKQAEDEIRRSREQMRALADHLQGVREEERKAIAREIHDELGQALTGIRMDLVWAMRKLPRTQKEVQRKLSSSVKLVDSTIKSVRKISSELRPGVLDDLGIAAAIEWQASEFENRTGVKCRLSLPEEQLEIDQARSTALFRIVQECLTNIQRYAAAKGVSIALEADANQLLLTVEDDGKGISAGKIKDPRSLGLLGMRERAAALGGEVTITGKPKKGTKVIVQLPAQDA